LQPATVTAREILLHFPHFAGKHWNLLFLRTQSQDTILSGIIPPNGRELLSQFAALQAGEQAPDLLLARPAAAATWPATTLLRSGELSAAYSLLFFYQNGCCSCKNRLVQLQISYVRLQDREVWLLDQQQELSLTEVASRSGFANRVSFYRQFKELTGFSPMEFQDLCKKPAFSQSRIKHQQMMTILPDGLYATVFE
jgi:AraC-like DNA-binding protein